MSKIKVDDNVVFAASVIKRLNHDARVVGMRGTVRELLSNGKVAVVDTFGTYPNEEGVSLRTIPVANLAVKGSLAYTTNPAPRIGTARPRRASQITKKAPSKRLVARRKVNTDDGYFPNPIGAENTEFPYVIMQSHKGKEENICACRTRTVAEVLHSLLTKHAAPGVVFYIRG